MTIAPSPLIDRQLLSSRDPSDPYDNRGHVTTTRKPQFSAEDPWNRVESSISPHVRLCQREFPPTYLEQYFYNLEAQAIMWCFISSKTINPFHKPCIFLWIWRGIPSVYLILSKLDTRRVPVWRYSWNSRRCIHLKEQTL